MEVVCPLISVIWSKIQEMRGHLRFVEKKLQKNYTRHFKLADFSYIKHEGGLPRFPTSRLLVWGLARDVLGHEGALLALCSCLSSGGAGSWCGGALSCWLHGCSAANHSRSQAAFEACVCIWLMSSSKYVNLA